VTASKPRNDAELVAAVTNITGFAFGDAARVRRALTHASAGEGKDYQRLEFLGDRVLGLVVAQMVFEANPGAPEGELSLRLNALVNAETLAEIADEIGLSGLIVAGSEMRTLTGRKRVNLRGDVMEALIAALYLEGGLEPARAFIRRYWEDRSKAPTAARRDAKTELQEWAHQQGNVHPSYVILDRSGPDHDPSFTVEVTVKGFAPETGEGRSKRIAEQSAAEAMLYRESVWKRDGSS